MSELFEESIINRQPRWPIMLRLIGASAGLHLGLLVLLFYVPGVRDTFNLAALLSNTGYVDRPYTLAEIREDVQLLTLARDKFHYPPGYFATEADWAQAQAQAQAQAAPAAITQAKVQPEMSPSPSPTPELSPSPSPTSSASPGSAANAEVTADSKVAEQKTGEQTEKELDKLAADNNMVRPSEGDINKRPLKDWLAAANELREKNQIDLNSTVELTILATMGEDCQFRDPVVVKKSGDDRLIEVAQKMALAINASNALSILRDPAKQKADKSVYCQPSPLKLAVKLDQSEITVRIELEADSATRAEQLAKTYYLMLAGGAYGARLKNKQEEATLYENTKVTSQDKQIIVDFSMPRQTAGEMLKKQLPPAS